MVANARDITGYRCALRRAAHPKAERAKPGRLIQRCLNSMRYAAGTCLMEEELALNLEFPANGLLVTWLLPRLAQRQAMRKSRAAGKSTLLISSHES